MSTIPYTPKIAAFWFVADNEKQSRLASYRWPFEMDWGPELKAVPQTHEEVWPAIQQIDGSLIGYAFDHFPRGRLEFYPPSRRWLISIDQRLEWPWFIDHLCQTWSLHPGRITVTVEPNYRSHARVGAP